MLRHRSELSLTLLAVLSMLIALLGLSMANTTWAAPGAQGTIPTATPTITPGAGAGPGVGPGPGAATETPNPAGIAVPCLIGITETLCTNLLGGATIGAMKFISVPVGAVISGTTLIITGPQAQPPCPDTPDGQVFLDHCFKTDWIGPDGQPLTSFNKPVYDCLNYSSGDVAMAGGNPSNFEIGLVIPPTPSWSFVAPTVEPSNSRVCANVGQVFTHQALFTLQPPLPVTGAANPPAWFGVAVLVMGFLALVVGGVWLNATRRAKA